MSPRRPPLAPGFEPRTVVDLAPGVRRITAPNPGLMTGPGTNTYLLGAERVLVVDPGPDHAGHVAAIVRAAGRRRVAGIVLTHTHPDHWPGARRLQARTGAPILAAPRSPAADGFDLPVAQRLRDRDRLSADDLAVIALHTPGHAPNHVCLWLPALGTLLSGDHVLDGTTTVVSPSRGGDMAAYLTSLRRLRALRGLASILPAHGGVIGDPRAKIDEYLRHRRLRERQILRLLRTGPMTPRDLVHGIYTDTPDGRPGGLPDGLVEMARRQIHAHLVKLRSEGRVVGRDLRSRWTLVR